MIQGHRPCAVAPHVGRLVLDVDHAYEPKQHATIEESAVQHVNHIETAALGARDRRELTPQVGGGDVVLTGDSVRAYRKGGRMRSDVPGEWIHVTPRDCRIAPRPCANDRPIAVIARPDTQALQSRRQRRGIDAQQVGRAAAAIQAERRLL